MLFFGVASRQVRERKALICRAYMLHIHLFNFPKNVCVDQNCQTLKAARILDEWQIQPSKHTRAQKKHTNNSRTEIGKSNDSGKTQQQQSNSRIQSQASHTHTHEHISRLINGIGARDMPHTSYTNTHTHTHIWNQYKQARIHGWKRQSCRHTSKQ